MKKTLSAFGAGALIAGGIGALAGAALITGAALTQSDHGFADPFLPWAISGGLAVGAVTGILAFVSGCGTHSLVRRSNNEKLAVTAGIVLASLVTGGAVLAAAIETRHTMPAALTTAAVIVAAGSALTFTHLTRKHGDRA